VRQVGYLLELHWRILVGLAATFGDCTGWCESLLTLVTVQDGVSNEKVIHVLFGAH